MKAFIVAWIEKAEVLVTSSIVWSSASQLQEQIRVHQASLQRKNRRNFCAKRLECV